MSTVPLRRRWLAVPAVLALTMVAWAQAANGASRSPCRVLNLDQDTHGRSLVRMVERARNGDRLHVRGTCRGHVVVDVDVLIRGKGEDPTLEGPGQWRTAVRVTRGVSVTIRDLTIQHGRGVRNEGRLTIQDSVVRRSNSSGIRNERFIMVITSIVRRNSDAGIQNAGGRLTVIDSIIAANEARYEGGGISNWGGTLTITGSIIRANSAGWGGGILNIGSATVSESTISGNTARTLGGGVLNGRPGDSEDGGTLSVIGSAVTDNVAGTEGGGIWNWQDFSTVTVDASSSVAGNTPDDCVGTPAC